LTAPSFGETPTGLEFVSDPLIVDGIMEMTERPGIGVEPDLDVARRWATAGEKFFGKEL